MKSSIYVNENNEMKTEEDLLFYLEAFKTYNPSRSHWEFDEILGGEDGFFEIEDYFKIKKLFNTYIKNRL